MVILLGLVAGCGRLGFDPLGSRDGGPLGDGDGPIGDAHVPIAPQFLQTTQAMATTGSSLSTGFTSPVAADDLIVVTVDFDHTSPVTASSVTDSLGSTFSIVGPDDGYAIANNNRQYIAYALATTSGSDTINVVLNASVLSYLELRIHEYASASLVAPFDSHAAGTSVTGGTDAAQTSALVTSEPNELIFGLIIDGTVTAGPSFTTRNTAFGDLTEDEVAQTPGSYTVVATTTNGWTASAVAFRGR